MKIGRQEMRTLSHIKSNTAQFAEANKEAMEASDGICCACDQYDTQVEEFGEHKFCRQRDCEAVRGHVDTQLGHRIVSGVETTIVKTPEALELAVPMYKQAFDNIKSGRGL